MSVSQQQIDENVELAKACIPSLLEDPSYLRMVRNQFAAAALTGLLSKEGSGTCRRFAETAFRFADAMLEEMKKESI